MIAVDQYELFEQVVGEGVDLFSEDIQETLRRVRLHLLSPQLPQLCLCHLVSGQVLTYLPALQHEAFFVSEAGGLLQAYR